MEHDTHAGHEHMDHDHMNHDHMDHGGHQNHTGHDDHGGHKDHTGHGGHGGHGDHVGQFRRLFWIMLVFAIPVVFFNGAFADIVGYDLPDAEWVRWISPVLGTVLYFWGGWPFITGAISEIRSRQPGMMLLIGLAITTAFIASWGSTLGLLDDQLNFWWELALLVVIMLLGHWIEMRHRWLRPRPPWIRWRHCYRMRRGSVSKVMTS